MPSEVLALAVVLSYGIGAWMIILRSAGVITEHSEQSLGAQWLSASTVALPLVLAGVAVALRAARMLVNRLSAGIPVGDGAAAMVRIMLTGLGAGVAFAIANPVYEWITATHVERTLPLAASITENAFVALVVALPVAALAERVGVLYARRAVEVPEVVVEEPRRRNRIPAMGTVVALTVLTVSTGTAGVATAATPSAGSGSVCPATAPVKHFDISAIDIKTPLNRDGDNNPAGKLFILDSKIPAARAEEQSQQVSNGLHDDPIQPLAIRANEGDCVTIHFTNSASGGNFGLHIDGLITNTAGDGIGNNGGSGVAEGSSTDYTYFVPNNRAMEGAHYLRPGPGFREAVGNGLFGEFVVEPPGSTYFDSVDGSPLTSGFEAMIVPGDGQASFREYVLMFHTIGNDNEVLFDKNGAALPQVDDLTDTYRPAAFAINDRSEPFRHRVAINSKELADGYSSYPFGDPSTPNPRAYLADPTKFRLTNGGAEKFHAFHLHGGGIRWRQDPVSDPTWNYADTGLQKDPVTLETPSMRNDSQAIGPGESYNLEIEGGAGGVQQTVGDLLFHCHIVKHYVAGMWSFWSVFNTKQPDLATLPGRTPPPDAVTSAELIGKTFNGTTITAQNLAQWVTPQLPPQGVRQNDQDAEVLDWTIDNSDPSAPLVLNEPEDLTSIPDSYNVIPGHPNLRLGDQLDPNLGGHRPILMFDPLNGRPAYPVLRTHVGDRPPFSPNGHSGAPYLGENANAAPTSSVDPFANRVDGLCPQGRFLRKFNIVAITKPIAKNAVDVDPNGEIYVLADHKDAVLANQYTDDPLAIRADQGDCVAVTLTSELTDAGDFGGFSKVNIHIHHVQFDIQGSDGVIVGFNYETAVRPYKAEDPQITANAPAGATSLTLSSTAKFQNGEFIGVGLGTDQIQVEKITSINGLTVTIDKPLTISHPAGEWAGAEFVQYRWYPDVVLDNIFFHDHVDAIHSWIHGLVGMFIVEPAGSTFTDPQTGLPRDSGSIVDIHTKTPLSPGLVDGSYREMAIWTIDDNNDDVDPGTLNNRTAPLSRRQDQNERFSSYKYGDPSTPLPQLYPGDTLVVRTINVGPNVDTLHFDGARYLPEFRMTDPSTGQHNAQFSDTLTYNDSERFTLVLGGDASGPTSKPGDYLYTNGDGRHVQQGDWGIVRVLDGKSPNLLPLPGNSPPANSATVHAGPASGGGGPNPPPTTDPGNPCPATAPIHTFNVSAVDMNTGNLRMGFKVTSSSATAGNASGGSSSDPAAPMVLHVAAGECVVVNLTNQRGNAPVGFLVGKLRKDAGSIGVNVGFDTEQNTLPGTTRQYVYYADSDHIGSATIANMAGDQGVSGDAASIPAGSSGQPVATKEGGYGSIVVSEPGATFTDQVTGAPTDFGNQVDVHLTDGTAYRDDTVILADNDPEIDQDHMPYPSFANQDVSFVNYRFGNNAASRNDGATAFSGSQPTTLLRAYAGDPVMVHEVIAPGTEQGHVFSLGGMSAPRDRFIPGAERTENQGLGPWASFDAKVLGGAGGLGHTVGDFYYGDLQRPFVQVGLWGIFRVMSDATCPIRPLPGLTCLGS